MRIFWQSFTDPVEHADYIGRLTQELERARDPATAVQVAGMTPPDRHLHRITEMRCAAQVIGNAIDAERDGCDAVLIGHFQDSGLYEARSAVSVPVLGLGETSMLHACTLGGRIGLVTIDPIFIPWHQEQVMRYGLERRVVGVTAMEALDVATYARACVDDTAFDHVVARFAAAARPLVDAGAEVLIPAGGLPSLVLSRRPGMTIDGAVVLNAVTVLLKHGEAAVKLKALGQPEASRRSTFAPPPDGCIAEFRAAQR